MTDRNASLVLKTSDITQKSDYVYGYSYSSAVGSMNAKGSSITWNNINLRTLLGDMYDKFDMFNICLNTISTSQANLIDTNADSKNINVKISGLPFINQTYNVKNGSNGSSTTIATFNFVPSTATTQYYYSNNIATFGKNSDICNITIEYWRILDDVIFNSNVIPVLSVITNLTGTGILGTNIIVLSATNNTIYLGAVISGVGIPANSFVTFVNGTTININNNLTANLNATALNISPVYTYPNSIFVFDIFGVPRDNTLNASRI